MRKEGTRKKEKNHPERGMNTMNQSMGRKMKGFAEEQRGERGWRYFWARMTLAYMFMHSCLHGWAKEYLDNQPSDKLSSFLSCLCLELLKREMDSSKILITGHLNSKRLAENLCQRDTNDQLDGISLRVDFSHFNFTTPMLSFGRWAEVVANKEEVGCWSCIERPSYIHLSPLTLLLFLCFPPLFLLFFLSRSWPLPPLSNPYGLFFLPSTSPPRVSPSSFNVHDSPISFSPRRTLPIPDRYYSRLFFLLLFSLLLLYLQTTLASEAQCFSSANKQTADTLQFHAIVIFFICFPLNLQICQIIWRKTTILNGFSKGRILTSCMIFPIYLYVLGMHLESKEVDRDRNCFPVQSWLGNFRKFLT